MTEPTTQPTAVGERLRWAREQSGLSQAQVAKMFEYHRPTISQIEAGQRVIRPDEIARFARIYDVKEAWIINGDSIFEEGNDPRIELAARELAKLRTNDLDSILRLIKVMRSKRGESGE
jgi:transcriptional regulator with XRE-family HTH domain